MKSSAIDVNGVFAAGCARHGIPTSMFNIDKGEGYIRKPFTFIIIITNILILDSSMH